VILTPKRRPRWVFQAVYVDTEHSTKTYLSKQLREVLKRAPDRRVVHWGLATHRKEVLKKPFVMKGGDLVLLFQGATPGSIRGFYGLAEIVNLKEKCQASYGGRGKHSRKGVDLRYLVRYRPHVRANSIDVESFEHPNLEALIHGPMGNGLPWGATFGITNSDWRRLSPYIPSETA